MDFTLSKQQQMVQKMYREFAENEVKPLAKKVDAEEYFPKETVEKMGKLGMMGIYFPTSVGGAGGDVLSYVMAVEELSKVCGTTGVIVSAHTSLCAAPIYENGTPEQKAKYLPKLCSGEWLGAFGLTEPGAGTDAQGQQTIAKEEDDCWVLNGSKIFITNAGFADVFIVIAVTDHVLDKKGRPTKLCSAFIVERTDPGFSVGKAQENIGIRQILIQIELPAHPDIFGGPLGTQKQHFRRTESRFSFRPSFGIEIDFFPTFLRFFQRIISFPSLYGSHIHNGIQGQIFFSHKTITLSIHPYHSDQRMIFTGPVLYRTVI